MHNYVYGHVALRSYLYLVDVIQVIYLKMLLHFIMLEASPVKDGGYECSPCMGISGSFVYA